MIKNLDEYNEKSKIIRDKVMTIKNQIADIQSDIDELNAVDEKTLESWGLTKVRATYEKGRIVAASDIKASISTFDNKSV
jgi:hypothetical protein